MKLTLLLKLTTFVIAKSISETIQLDGGSLKITEYLPSEMETQIIPKTFHTIWLDFGKGEEVFPKYVENMEKLKALHPDWEFKLWKKDDILTLIKNEFPYFKETFINYDRAIKMHDSARILILYSQGGVYLDQDFIPLRNINPIMKFYNFVIGNEEKDDFTPVNGFIGSIAGHGLLKMMIEEMAKPETASKFVLEATGPGMVKKTMLEYAKNHDLKYIKVYSNKFFYPVSYKNKKILKNNSISNLMNKFPHCYLLQEYDASWQ